MGRAGTQFVAAEPTVDGTADGTVDRATDGRGARRLGDVTDPGQDAAPALAGLLLGLLDTIERNVPGAIDGADAAFLHAVRVAVRRTRSALRLAGDVLPEGVAERFGAEFAWLGDLTTPVRDLDVFLMTFDAVSDTLTEADPTDLEPLRVYLRRRRAVERRRLRAGLRSARLGDLTAQWRATLTSVVQTPSSEGEGPRPDVGTVARRRIDRAWRRVARRGRVLTPESPAAALHDLRKRCKELRYVLELFAGVCHREPYRAIRRDLKRLQNSLGAHQDAEVHRDQVRRYAAAMVAAGLASADTMLAMGELVVRFADRQREQAQVSLARVEQFLTPDNRALMSGLVRPGVAPRG